ncbi:ribosome maturation factor RimM [Chloroflexota bacterium]
MMKSPQPEFIIIGKILAPSGIQGKLKVKVLTDFPQRFTPGVEIYINRQLMTIDSTAWHKGKAIIKLNTIDCREDAERLEGQLLEIHHSQLQALPDEEYYYFQLIGLEVWTTVGKLLGNITDILAAAGNDNYVVSGAEGEILIPAISDVVKSVDLNQGRMMVEPITGLLSLNEKKGS